MVAVSIGLFSEFYGMFHVEHFDLHKKRDPQVSIFI